MFGFSSLGEFGLADIGDDFIDESEFAKFIRSDRPSRFLLEFSAIKRQGGYLGETVDFSLAENALGEIPGGSVVLDEKKYALSDGPWIGRPDDIYQTNRFFDPRIVSTSDIERTMPLNPEASRRGEVTVGAFELTNVDGAYDELISERSIANRSMRLYFGPALSKFNAFRLVSELIGQSFENTLDTIRMRVVSTAAYLSSPFHILRYDGTGGRGGDIALKDTLVPVCYGDVFNITPVLERQDIYMYRVHDAAMLAVDSVKERGLPFINDGDVSNYNQLVAATAPAGHYLTCLTEGRFRAGFAGGPAGPITCDVRGDVDASGYTAETGEVLLKIALNRSRISVTDIDVSSFLNLPSADIGYYSAQDDISVSQVFDDLLRAINGWYGTRRSKLLRCEYILPPEGRPTAKTITNSEVLNIEETEISQPPRYEQAVIYRKNWTVMDEDDVSLTLDSDVRGALLSDGNTLRTIAQDVKVRDRNAIVGATITTYFRDEQPAQEVLSRVMSLYRETRRQFKVTISREGYLLDLQNYLRLENKRLGLLLGMNVIVIGIRDESKTQQTELTLWG